MASLFPSIVGRLSALTASLTVLAVAQAANAQVGSRGYDPPEYHDGQTHYEKKEENFGRFTVVRYIEDCRAVPMLDFGCWLTKEAQLQWHDSTGKIGLSFIDNGYGVRFRAEGESADGKTTCLMQSVLVGYDPKPSKVENWKNLRPFISQQIRGCTAIGPVDLNRALSEMQISETYYVSAANAWKAVSAELFGSNDRRCIAQRMTDRISMPPRFECTRYSKP